MPVAARLALLALVIGGILGLLVLGAAAAAGRQKRLPFWLAGTAWGLLTAGMMLSDCAAGAGMGPGALSRSAFPVFFAGLAGFPVAVIWGQKPWLLKWFLAQLILLVAIAPAFFTAVISALCSFT
ncbi:MAG TPA: hypothetical protein VD969_20140 [Symbiobacteriaceae bacterium]|nr:hypothetical protein [Symbiobacteriaceae bacterium]